MTPRVMAAVTVLGIVLIVALIALGMLLGRREAASAACRDLGGSYVNAWDGWHCVGEKR